MFVGPTITSPNLWLNVMKGLGLFIELWRSGGGLILTILTVLILTILTVLILTILTVLILTILT